MINIVQMICEYICKQASNKEVKYLFKKYK